MKVSELTDAKLDYWVAKSNGESPFLVHGICTLNYPQYPEEPITLYSPSTDWSQGGPIIECNDIASYKSPGGWHCTLPEGTCSMWNSSLLIAAMRCFVASKYGEEVPDES